MLNTLQSQTFVVGPNLQRGASERRSVQSTKMPSSRGLRARRGKQDALRHVDLKRDVSTYDAVADSVSDKPKGNFQMCQEK